VPGVYRQILKHAAEEARNLPSLRHGLSAGAALTPDLLAQWRTHTGKDIFEAYGMSEISTFISSGPKTPVRLARRAALSRPARRGASARGGEALWQPAKPA